MDLVILGDIFCDILANNVKSLPQWNTDVLAQKISTVAGGTGLNTSVHAANYVQWLSKSPKHMEDIKVHLFSAVCNDSLGQICKDRLKDYFPTLVDRVIHAPVEHVSTGSCIVISGHEDRCFITDRGCIRHLAVNWFPEHDLLGSEIPSTSPSAAAANYGTNELTVHTNNRIRHLHIAGYYNCDSLSNGLCDLLCKVKSILYVKRMTYKFFL